MPDIGWRQINESSSKNDGIEFFATHRDELRSHHARLHRGPPSLRQQAENA
jgi:hypothetical protein